MLSCKQATRLVSEGLDRELPFLQRMSLRFHVVMCRGCSRYKRQITALSSLITDHYRDYPPAEVSDDVLQEAVQHIKSSLRLATPGTDVQNGK